MGACKVGQSLSARHLAAFQKLTHAAEADSAYLQTLAQIALDQLQGHELRRTICVTLRTLSAMR